MKWDNLANERVIRETIEALGKNGVEAEAVEDGTTALERIKSLIPKGATVMNGSSRTLEEIGFIEYLKSGDHPWKNLHAEIVAQKDPDEQARLRKQALLAEYYLGSVHALSQTGEFLIASNTGSQLPHVVFSSPNLIFVVGTQKIVSTVGDAWKRLEEHVIPLEEQNMRQKYGVGTYPSKVLFFRRENPMTGRKVRMLLVLGKLGF
jgi:hypothetical protein